MIDLIWICLRPERRTYHFPLAEYFVNKLPHFLFHLNKNVWEMFNFGRSNISTGANDSATAHRTFNKTQFMNINRRQFKLYNTFTTHTHCSSLPCDPNAQNSKKKIY